MKIDFVMVEAGENERVRNRVLEAFGAGHPA
jgi:hypothetical protein